MGSSYKRTEEEMNENWMDWIGSIEQDDWMDWNLDKINKNDLDQDDKAKSSRHWMNPLHVSMKNKGVSLHVRVSESSNRTDSVIIYIHAFITKNEIQYMYI